MVRSCLQSSICARLGKGHQVGKVEQISIVSNNACLFACFNYLLHKNTTNEQEIRVTAAKIIKDDTETFTDITLEKPKDKYIEWILQEKSWGGYLELIALSRAYEIEVIVIDGATGRKDEYGDSSHGKRIILAYDGLHYDAIAANDSCCPGEKITVFDPNDKGTLQKAVELVGEIYRKRKAEKGKSILRCSVCGGGFPSQTSAIEHARCTGHESFREIDKN